MFFTCSIGQNHFARGFYRNDTVIKDAAPSLHFDPRLNHKQAFVFQFSRFNCKKQTSHIMRRRRKQIARRTQQFKGRSILIGRPWKRSQGPSLAPPKHVRQGNSFRLNPLAVRVVPLAPRLLPFSLLRLPQIEDFLIVLPIVGRQRVDEDVNVGHRAGTVEERIKRVDAENPLPPKRLVLLESAEEAFNQRPLDAELSARVFLDDEEVGTDDSPPRYPLSPRSVARPTSPLIAALSVRITVTSWTDPGRPVDTNAAFPVRELTTTSFLTQ